MTNVKKACKDANSYAHPYWIGLAPLPVQRSLKLVAKVIQRLANLNSVSHPAPHFNLILVTVLISDAA